MPAPPDFISFKVKRQQTVAKHGQLQVLPSRHGSIAGHYNIVSVGHSAASSPYYHNRPRNNFKIMAAKKALIWKFGILAL